MGQDNSIQNSTSSVLSGNFRDVPSFLLGASESIQVDKIKQHEFDDECTVLWKCDFKS